ncbi:VrtH [Diplocarpon rosae]|nr:VrtH [Diplocarpon rosae]
MTLMQPVHIVGAGIGGLTLARCLRYKGIQAVIFEKNPSPAYHNYGISLQPWTCRLLVKILGIDEKTFVRKVAVDGLRGGQGIAYADEHPLISTSQSETGLSPFRAHRGRLEALLREDLDEKVKWGYALQNIASHTASGTGHLLAFKDKESVNSRFVVDTLGVHSQIRRSLLPDLELNVLPYVVFRGTRRIEEVKFKDLYQERFGSGNIVEMKQADVLLQISINNYTPDDGGVDISLIYSRPARSNDALHRPGRITGESSNIADAFFDEVSNLGELEQPFQDAFDEKKVRSGRTLHWLMRDLLVPLEELKGLAERGVVVVGDAAHALPILGGDGACFAIRDAEALAEAVARGKCLGGLYEDLFSGWEEGVKKGRERLVDMHKSGKSACNL